MALYFVFSVIAVIIGDYLVPKIRDSVVEKIVEYLVAPIVGYLLALFSSIGRRLGYLFGYNTNIEEEFQSDAEDFDSRKLILKEIMEALKDDRINMIGVYGVGGVGKTTLVGAVRKQAKGDNLFDEIVMAAVSQTPNIRRIQGDIADMLDLKLDAEGEPGRARQLSARLKKKKRILVILDDIWEEIQLGAIGIPFGANHRGCKIILTSRRLDVCKQMQSQKNFSIQVLTEPEAWNLFRKMAGDSADSPDLHPLAVQMARESKGLPIAIVTRGTAWKNMSLSDRRDAANQLRKSMIQKRWFSVDEEEPVAYATVEVIEASDMKPSKLNGLADPYVKGQLGLYRFRTKTQKKTLAPKWHEEFKVPICTWESPNVLAIEVCNKGHFFDDTLGECTVNISDLRDGQRHDMWLPLQKIKMGRLHLAITLLEDNGKGDDHPFGGETLNKEDLRNSFTSETAHKDSFSSVRSEKSPKVADSFEPINIEGQQETGIWVHHPGSEVSQTWEPRRGKNRRLDTQIHSEANDCTFSFNLAASGSDPYDSSSSDEIPEGNKSMNTVWRGIRKISSVFYRSPKTEDQSSSIGEPVPSPHDNLKAVNTRKIGINLIVEDDLSGLPHGNVPKAEGSLSPEGSDPESPSKGNVKDMAKGILKHAGKSARTIKHAISRKGSRKSLGDSCSVQTERELLVESDYADVQSLPCSVHSPRVERIPSVSKDPVDSNLDNAQTGSIESAMNAEDSMMEEKLNGLADDRANNSQVRDDGLVEESSNPKLPQGNVRGEKILA